MIMSVLRVGLLAWLGIAAVLYAFQASLIYYPHQDLVATPDSIGLAYQDVDLVTSDGVAIHGWYLPHPNARGTLLFFHGNAGNISHRLDSIELFHRLGLAVLIIDYRGYGRSQGKPGEEGSYRDAEAAWNWLVGQQGVDPARIVVFGRSLGGAIATWLAHQQRGRDRPAALILESTFTSVPDMGAKLYPFLPIRWLARIHYDSLSRIAEIEAPLWLAHGPADEIVPYEQGRRLFDAAAEPKQFFELRGGHNDGFLASGAAYREALDGFLDAVLASER